MLLLPGGCWTLLLIALDQRLGAARWQLGRRGSLQGGSGLCWGVMVLPRVGVRLSFGGPVAVLASPQDHVGRRMQTPPEMLAQPWSSLAWMDQEELAYASTVPQVFAACSSLLQGNLISPCQGQPSRGGFRKGHSNS